MKHQTLTHLHGRLGKLSTTICLAVMAATSAFADVVYVSTLTSNCTSTTICGNGANPALNSQGQPVYAEPPGVLASFTAAISVAPGKPSEPGARFFSNTFSNTTPDLGVTVSPTLAVPGGVYQVYHVYTSTAGNASTDIVMGVTNVDGCTLSFNSTTKFQRSFGTLVSGQNVWQLLGFITNNVGVSNPVVRFYRLSGTSSAGASARVIFDTFRFNFYQPCLDIAPVGVTGPLATNVTTVTVTGVSNAATAITLYQDAGTGFTNIGTITTSAPPANVAVPVTGVLVRGAQVAATQTAGGQEGCLPTSGVVVGGGANPSLRIALSIRYDPTMTGPVGSPGTTAGNVYYLGASSTLAGSAPAEGAILQPSTCWQTISFTRGDENAPTDPSVLWVGVGPATLAGHYGALDGLAIACEGDPGPVKIYLDHLENGTNGVVQNWEGAANGQASYGFSQPSFSGTTAANLLGLPNECVATNEYAYDGTKSARVQFQFRDGANTRWVRFVTANSTPVQNPQLDLTQPISIKILVLPVGQTAAHTFTGTVSGITNSPPYTGGDTTLGVTVTGGPFTYQWSYNGTTITDETNRTLTIVNLSTANNGVYTLVVNDGTCSDSKSMYLAVADPLPSITNQPAAKTIAHVGDNVTFTVGADGHVAGGYPLTYQWRFNATDITGATDSAFTTNNVQVANAGTYDVVVGNTFGSAQSLGAVLDVVGAGVTIGTGTGLRGDYYTLHTNGVNEFIGVPTLTRTDPAINFNFGVGSPSALVSTDYFVVRWSGQVQALDSDTYTFYTTTDDGVRLWVGGQLLIDHWAAQAPTEYSASLALTQNQKYDVIMEYFERTVGAVAQLSWSSAGGGVVKEIVPTSQIYPATGLPAPSLSFGLTDQTNLVLNWGPGAYSIAWATNVDGSYTNIVPGVISPYTNIIGPERSRFLRLRVQ